jgi:hypothetical protein
VFTNCVSKEFKQDLFKIVEPYLVGVGASNIIYKDYPYYFDSLTAKPMTTHIKLETVGIEIDLFDYTCVILGRIIDFL